MPLILCIMVAKNDDGTSYSPCPPYTPMGIVLECTSLYIHPFLSSHLCLWMWLSILEYSWITKEPPDDYFPTSNEIMTFLLWSSPFVSLHFVFIQHQIIHSMWHKNDWTELWNWSNAKNTSNKITCFCCWVYHMFLLHILYILFSHIIK